MNIRFIIGNTVDSDDYSVTEVNEKVLPLCGQGRPEGQAEGLMPLKLANGVVVTPKVTVYTSTSTNRKGAVSAVVKVSIPYTALKLSDDGSAIAGSDAARSGAELSMHTVITLPSAAVADLKGANGTTMQANAERQVAVVVRLLTALLLQRMVDPGFTENEGGSLQPTATRKVVQSTIGASSAQRVIASSSLIPTDQITGFAGNVGFDVTSYSMPRSLSEILSRIVAKQAPIGCSDIVAESIAY